MKKPPIKKHMSMKEQIALYNQLNRDIFKEEETP
jgi:ribosomal protein L31E